MRDNEKLIWFDKYDQHKNLYTFGLLTLYLFINNTINASSVWIEHNRTDDVRIQMWEPFVWEYSSAISTLILLPMVFIVFRRTPLRFTRIPTQFAIHFCASVVYSAAHVGLMVWLREGVYALQGISYDFGPWLHEFWYEYRKDAWGYVFWLFMFHVFRSLYARLKGEASLVDKQSESPAADLPSIDVPGSAPEFLLVRKLDKEFLVKVQEIEWIESSGNYVNLHKEGRIYPLRGTLNDTVSRLSVIGFSRVHRSHAVNLNAIDNIQYQASGDGKINLKSGVTLNLSRRYKDQLKNSLI